MGLYPVAYYPHNYHFLAFAATMAGQSATAIDAARRVVGALPSEVALMVPFLETVPAYVHLALVSFGRWDDVLAEPMPAAELRTANGMAHYARGVALAANERATDAAVALDSLRAIADQSLAERGEGGATALLQIAVHSLMGEIATRGGRPAEGAPHFRIAARLEDGLPYDEPPPWYYPVRHSLGKSLLAAGQAGQAEAVFREDLAKFPANGWSLFGLAQSLEAQGKTAEAGAVRAQFEEAWATADVSLAAARY
jgi:tetratricopeptide (TPR) repeat protein